MREAIINPLLLMDGKLFPKFLFDAGRSLDLPPPPSAAA
jgi:hypothetical protein